MADYNWPFLILGNLALGFLLSYVLSKSGTGGFGGGASMGAVVGFLTALSFDSVVFATGNVSTMKGMFIDIIGFTIMCAIVGGIVGAYLGMGKAKT